MAFSKKNIRYATWKKLKRKCVTIIFNLHLYCCLKKFVKKICIYRYDTEFFQLS